jgi:hypothetical protein
MKKNYVFYVLWVEQHHHLLKLLHLRLLHQLLQVRMHLLFHHQHLMAHQQLLYHR